LDRPYLNEIIERVEDKSEVATLLGERRKVPVFNGTVKMRPSALRQPLYLPDDEQVFVAGCPDLFHKDVPFEYVEKVFSVVEARPTLVFFVITRRPTRALEFAAGRRWPENLWVGVSGESQELFDKRVKFLGQIPAKYRGVSIKPMLGPVDIRSRAGDYNFIIVGGQSGLGSYPMHPDWVRMVRDACKDLRVAFQFHQWGSWGLECGERCSGHIWMTSDQKLNIDGDGVCFHRVGSRCTGKTLDGEEWDQYPDTYGG